MRKFEIEVMSLDAMQVPSLCMSRNMMARIMQPGRNPYSSEFLNLT